MNARGMFKERIHIRQGDITQVRVEAIVNAANTTLLGGGGVDGTLHRAAGPALLEECRALGGCPTGESRMTGGHKLPAKYVIHTVGPLWRGGNANEPALLASCYSSALQLAHEYHLQTIAFPAISTGAYRFPFETATSIALEAVAIFLGKHDLPREVHLLFHTHTDYQKAVSILERSPWAA